MTVAALVAGLGLAAPAAAHDVLLESSPADGAVLDVAPTEVALTFSADQIDLGAAITVTDASGVDRGEGDAVVEGPVVRRALAADLPAGVYQVAWRSVSSDGHALTGELSFEVTAAAAPVEPAEPVEPEETAAADGDAVAPADEPTTSDEPTPSAEPTSTADAGADADADDDVAADDGGGGVPVWLLVVLGVLVIGGAAFALLRRNRSSES